MQELHSASISTSPLGGQCLYFILIYRVKKKVEKILNILKLNFIQFINFKYWQTFFKFTILL